MKYGNISFGEAELEIMKVLWKAGEAVNSQYISEAVKDREWKRTTILTFLARLADKGAVSAEKRGKFHYYTPLISQREYRKAQTKNLIASLYNGSVRDFAVSFFEEQKVSDEDIKELRAIFNEHKEE